MRHQRLWIVALMLVPSVLFAQKEAAPQPVRPAMRCCTPVVVDAKGKVLGDVIRYDDRFGSVQLNALVSYRLAGGDTVPLSVGPEYIVGLQATGGSNMLFTTPDCSGTTAYAMIYNPPLTKRYAMVLPVGSPGGFGATQAWLWVTDAIPARVNPPPGTIFHSQWGDTGSCSPYPAPGYTFAPSPMGLFVVHKVEDLYTKFTRPFYVQ
ncbi:MAG TPA: hypothetical protein VGQ46_01525 [Thermoanaerobaculia bacterium]|jgi:hypothetical protein|nr:hypothetical protein [Thermoanaerobaculia bacterium]